MKCPQCKHPMSAHTDGCTHVNKGGDFCFCCLEEGDIALLLLPQLEKKIARLEKWISEMNEMLLEER